MYKIIIRLNLRKSELIPTKHPERRYTEMLQNFDALVQYTIAACAMPSVGRDREIPAQEVYYGIKANPSSSKYPIEPAWPLTGLME
jgi:hypothetical protein